jgi:hypothetical protein
MSRSRSRTAGANSRRDSREDDYSEDGGEQSSGAGTAFDQDGEGGQYDEVGV